MPELRKDPIIDRWIIIATERARRPGKIVDPQHTFPTDVFEQATPEPLLRNDQEFVRTTRGLYDVINGYGAHEIIHETAKPVANMADLSVEEIQAAITQYAQRIKTLEGNTNLKYCFIYKKYLGGNVNHGCSSSSHLLASAVIPIAVKEKLIGAKNYFDAHKRCIFSDMIKQESEDKVRFVAENDHFAAVTPFASRFPFEVWIIPKKQSCQFADGIHGLEKDLAFMLKDILLRYKIGLDDPGYSFVINNAPFIRLKKTSSHFKTIAQDYCWHIELKPKLTHVAGFEKGTGFYICTIPPEMTAKYLRKVKV